MNLQHYLYLNPNLLQQDVILPCAIRKGSKAEGVCIGEATVRAGGRSMREPDFYLPPFLFPAILQLAARSFSENAPIPLQSFFFGSNCSQLHKNKSIKSTLKFKRAIRYDTLT